MDNYIAMGTTPTISVVIKDDEGQGLDFSRVITSSFRFYFKQDNGRVVVSKLGGAINVTPEESKVSTYLTQEDTMKFVKGFVDIEVRFLFKAILPNGENKAGKTTIHKVPIGTVLKKEVVTNE